MCYTCLTDPRTTREEWEECLSSRSIHMTVEEVVEDILCAEEEVDDLILGDEARKSLCEYCAMQFLPKTQGVDLTISEIMQIAGFVRGYRFIMPTVE